METQTSYQWSYQNQSPAPIPEPGSVILLIAGALIVGYFIRRNMK